MSTPLNRAIAVPVGAAVASARLTALSVRRATELTRWFVRATGISLPGLQVAVAFFCASLTPSLLPRTSFVQGVISGLCATAGYAVGVLVVWLVGPSVPQRLRLSSWMPRYTRPVLTGVSALLCAVMMSFGSVWQRELYVLMGVPPEEPPAYLGVLGLTILLLMFAILLGRGLRIAARVSTRRLRRWIPPAAAQVTAVTLVTLLTYGLVDGIVLDGLLEAASATAAELNATKGIDAPRPIVPTRSGSPASLVTWESLGAQGRAFVTGGPTREQLQTFTGGPAREPIRVYVGLESAPSLAAGAELAVRELERTGAGTRAVLCVVTTTGTGWVDPYVAAALEYMYGGDTAIVATQYSYLPSWISFLTEQGQTGTAAWELFHRVHEWWSRLPEQQRPQLIIFGESLGSLGSESIFRDLDDVLSATEGVLWAGPTQRNPLWAKLVAERDPGSPEVLPVYEGGARVRFASGPRDLEQPSEPWPHPRVVYLQNASDPVTWWSPRLAVRRPDWLREPPGRDVLPAMRWFPLVTFLQVTADLALAYDAPAGHGHEFHPAVVPALVAITEPADWSQERSAELTALLDAEFSD